MFTASFFAPPQTARSGNNIGELLGSICPECNQDDWKAFYAYCMPLMTLYARRAGLRRADAEDVAANAMSKLFVLVSEGRFQANRTIRGYLATMIRNEACDYYRATKEFYGNCAGMLCDSAKPEMQFDGGQYDENGEVSDSEVRQRLEVLAVAMRIAKTRVAESSWRMFCDVTVEGLPPQDVADALCVKVQTVYQRNFQIKRMIREAYEAICQ